MYQDIQTYKAIFSAIDRDKDGFISLTELCDAFD